MVQATANTPSLRMCSVYENFYEYSSPCEFYTKYSCSYAPFEWIAPMILNHDAMLHAMCQRDLPLVATVYVIDLTRSRTISIERIFQLIEVKRPFNVK